MVKNQAPNTNFIKSILPTIKNKTRKVQLMLRLKYELKKQQKEGREKRKKQREKTGEAPLAPKTIESMRVPEDSFVTSDNEEVKNDENIDEFASYYKEGVLPKIIVTTKRRPSEQLIKFAKEVQGIMPNAEYYDRRTYDMKEICEYASNREYTDVLVFNEKNKEPEGLWIIHLPEGPTAHFRVSNTWKRREIPNHGTPTGYYPELIMKNFDTRLGQRIGRMLASLFPQKPEFRGRNVVTMKNQRDFIFFRHHRYLFKEDGKKVILQEVGPRLTLKLRSLQSGIFNTESGEYEFLYQPNMQVNRKKFFL
ncbi:RPF1 [Blepharisma stoltei]|uniref:Brix domain-containing protein n=1 Tax=Blepharisma stoltei TaxID=1481888 RepID=A0AAU9KJ27_9CILI|nr:unnamed protein product [Blepharisma stoltei]